MKRLVGRLNRVRPYLNLLIGGSIAAQLFAAITNNFQFDPMASYFLLLLLEFAVIAMALAALTLFGPVAVWSLYKRTARWVGARV